MHQSVLAQGDDFELAVFVRISNQAKIDHVAEDIFIDLIGPAILDVHIHGRIGLLRNFLM